jgi:hypothetical protein
MNLGVYALGVVDERERQAVASHLVICPECRAELARLEPLPGLLAQVPESRWAAHLHATQRPVTAAADLAAVSDDGPPAAGSSARAPRSPRAGVPARPGLGRRVRARPWQAIAATAAAAAAAGVAGGFWLAQPGTSPAKPVITASGANPATHVRATIALTGTSWGTSIRLVASGLPLNVPCRLIVHSRSGGTEVTGVWDAWSKGSVSIPASAGWRPGDIASLQVATATRVLVTITAGRSGTHAPPSSHPGSGQ